ncbi:MAG TPA: C39 family peptidase [Myxococcaceae bacterium]|nr:C39 family peptidase [Myxococcaceae bacterium]
MALPPLPVGANPTLHTAQDRLHKQLDSASDRFHKQNDATQHLMEDGFHADEQALDAAKKEATAGLDGDAKKTIEDQFKAQADGLHRRRSGLHKAVEQQNHTSEEQLKQGYHGVLEQAKREGRLPTAAELAQINAGTGAAPYINQLNPAERDPQYQGQVYCGPTVMAMIARSRGIGEGLSDSQLIEQFAQIGRTNAKGTTGNGMVAIGEALGLQANAAQGADLSFINGQLGQGRPVVAMGNYFALPPHVQAGQNSGHYVLVQGTDALGNYRLSDPMTDKVTVVTPETLRGFMAGNPEGQFALSFG